MYRSRELIDTGVRWAARAQMWFFDTFEAIWAVRNEAEHGNDWETERLIQLTQCNRAVQRVYKKRGGSPLRGTASVPWLDRRSTSATGSDARIMDRQDNCVSTQSIPTTASEVTSPAGYNQLLRTITRVVVSQERELSTILWSFFLFFILVTQLQTVRSEGVIFKVL